MRWYFYKKIQIWYYEKWNVKSNETALEKKEKRKDKGVRKYLASVYSK